MKNMFATTWSKPIATKAMIGKKIASTLPAMSSAAIAIQTARQTSQLQPTARRKICHSVSSIALRASAMSPSRASGSSSVTTPLWTARK